MSVFDNIFKKKTSNVQKVINQTHQVIRDLGESSKTANQGKNNDALKSIEKTGSKLFDEIISLYINNYSERVNKLNSTFKEYIEYVTYYLDTYDNGINTTNEDLKRYYNFDYNISANNNIKNVLYSVIIMTINEKSLQKNSKEYLKGLIDEVIECMISRKSNNGICSPNEWQNIIDKLTEYSQQLAEIIQGLNSNDSLENNKAVNASLHFSMDFGSIMIPDKVIISAESHIGRLNETKKELQYEEIKRRIEAQNEIEREQGSSGLNR